MELETLTKTNQQLLEEIERLKISIQELSILNEIATAITSTLSVEKIIDLIVTKCIKHLHVEQCAVMLLNLENKITPFQTMVRRADVSKFTLSYKLDTQLTGWMIKYQKPLLINDFERDERIQVKDQADFAICNLLSVPLLYKSEMIGVLTVFNKKHKKEFTADDQRLLSIIAAQSAQVIENAKLFEDEQKYLILQEELNTAKEIQVNLLPKEPPKIDGYDFSAINIPAKEVGGDYFDFIKISDSKLGFCLGDITGKGLPAALLMANLQATLRGQTLYTDCCCEGIKRVNRLLYLSTDPTKFATLFFGIIDTQNHTLTFCNAGHDNPFLIQQDDKIKRLYTGGLLLGCLPDYTYQEEVVQFNPENLLALYSDGVTEAMNEADEEFGEQRLQKILLDNRNNSSENIIKSVLNEVRKHAGNRPQSDDITLMIIKRIK
jgi:sigma-B regulation protein RsbU (phosphoserine phosphatase)